MEPPPQQEHEMSNKENVTGLAEFIPAEPPKKTRTMVSLLPVPFDRISVMAEELGVTKGKVVEALLDYYDKHNG